LARRFWIAGRGRLTVTPAGQLFRHRAQAILNEAAEARAELAMRDLARLSRFNLGMIEDFDADVTPALLTGLAEDLSGHAVPAGNRAKPPAL
jgi:DNA-binding transcriptional LysR family regulator